MNKHYKNELATAESMLTDAVFKCFGNGCAKEHSFREFFEADCCEASKREHTLVLSFNIFIVEISREALWAG